MALPTMVSKLGEAVLIAGCRIHYVGLFPVCPNGADIYDATPSVAR